MIKTLREEGRLKPVKSFEKQADMPIQLTMSANSVFLITVSA